MDSAVLVKERPMADAVADGSWRRMSLPTAKTGAVVDGQDVLPSSQSVLFGIVYMASANMAKGADVFVNAGNALVENEGVGNDGAGNAPGLRVFEFAFFGFGDALDLDDVGQAEHGEDFVGQMDGGGVFQNRDGAVDAGRTRVGGLVKSAFRNGDKVDEIGQIAD